MKLIAIGFISQYTGTGLGSAVTLDSCSIIFKPSISDDLNRGWGK
jgi:hypothetical protein